VLVCGEYTENECLASTLSLTPFSSYPSYFFHPPFLYITYPVRIGIAGKLWLLPPLGLQGRLQGLLHARGPGVGGRHGGVVSVFGGHLALCDELVLRPGGLEVEVALWMCVRGVEEWMDGVRKVSAEAKG
jgi:hypothetical protein